MIRTLIVIWAIALLLLPALQPAAAADPISPKTKNELVSLSSDALIHAGDGNWDAVKNTLNHIESNWIDMAADDSKQAAGVTEALSLAQKAVQDAKTDPAAASKAVSALVKSLDTYLSSGEEQNQSSSLKNELESMLPFIKDTLAKVQSSDWTGANTSYNGFVTEWGKAEAAIRKADSRLYGKIEVKLSGVRIALNTDPTDQERAQSQLQSLMEGAETIIFYVGMASSIETSKLVLGTGSAAAVLAVFAFIVLKASTAIPVRPFFRLAGLLLYNMAFKFLGVGIHALQVSNTISAHTSGSLPDIEALGMYNSWEVFIPQMTVLLIILINILRIEWNKRDAAVASA
ncbi:hypothetical protein [Paenibacillus gansuensis]|uniref:Uncharacterized protein n=1 Tax=Paenibacillus gansuensis TaxID=306542 RepID=A0ABW5PB58_9BACL